MKKLILLFTALMVLSTANAELKNGNATLINEVKTANSGTKTISCKFTRTQKMAMVTTAQTKDGQFNYTKPNRLSMKYVDGETVIIKDGKVTVSMGGQVHNVKATNKQVDALATTLLACMSGDLNMLDGEMTGAEKKNGLITFKIKVDFSVGKMSYSALEIQYDTKDMTLKNMNMIQADGSYTLYSLQEKTVNGKIEDSVYSL